MIKRNTHSKAQKVTHTRTAIVFLQQFTSVALIVLSLFGIRYLFKSRVNQVYRNFVLRDEVLEAFMGDEQGKILAVSSTYSLFYKKISKEKDSSLTIKETSLSVKLSPIFLKYSIAKGVEAELEKDMLRKTQPYVFYNKGKVWVATVVSSALNSSEHYFVAKALW